MKKPDTWMPLYVGDLLADTLFLSRDDFGSYLLLIMAYWRNKGPLPDDDAHLKQIARVKDQDWARTRGVLMRFFEVGNDVWRHKRIDAEYADALQQYKDQCARTEAARQAKLAKGSVTTPVTDNVTDSVTGNVTGSQPQPQPQPQVQSESQPQNLERESNSPADANIPTLAEVKKLGSCRGILPEVCQSFYDYHEGNQLWLNKHGRLINWQHKLTHWQVKDRQPRPGRVSNVNVQEQGLSGADKVILQNEMERILARIKSIKDDYSSHQDMSDSDLAKIKDLRIRLKEIKTKLGVKY